MGMAVKQNGDDVFNHLQVNNVKLDEKLLSNVQLQRINRKGW